LRARRATVVGDGRSPRRPVDGFERSRIERLFRIDDNHTAQVGQTASDASQGVEPGPVDDSQGCAAAFQLVLQEAAGQVDVEEDGHGAEAAQPELDAHEIQAVR
jgi:hypothetical protein